MLRALAEGRVRRPGRWPSCPVCAAAMWAVEREGCLLELHCSDCGSVLADADESSTPLRLVA